MRCGLWCFIALPWWGSWYVMWRWWWWGVCCIHMRAVWRQRHLAKPRGRVPASRQTGMTTTATTELGFRNRFPGGVADGVRITVGWDLGFGGGEVRQELFGASAYCLLATWMTSDISCREPVLVVTGYLSGYCIGVPLYVSNNLNVTRGSHSVLMR